MEPKISKHGFVLIIGSLWYAVQEYLLYANFSVILFVSIQTLRKIASLFPDYVYCKPTLLLLYSYASLCILIPTFDLVASAIGHPPVFLVEAFLEQILQLLLTSLIVWYLKNLTKVRKVDQDNRINAYVFHRVEFDRVFNEYARLQ
jgi:hypothetical protein